MSMPTWLSDVVKVGEGVLSVAAPELAPVVGIVNSLLPSDKQLPQNATGNQVAAAYQGLNPDQQVQIREKMLDTQASMYSTQGDAIKAMFASAATAPNDEHGIIALKSFRVIAFTIITMVSLWSYAVATNNDAMVKSINGGGVLVLTWIAPLVYVLKSYFGAVIVQHANNVKAATGQDTVVGGIVATIANAFKRGS